MHTQDTQGARALTHRTDASELMHGLIWTEEPTKGRDEGVGGGGEGEHQPQTHYSATISTRYSAGSATTTPT